MLRHRIALVAALVQFAALVELTSTGGQKLLIDHDGGADDAMAIFMSLLYETHFQGPKLVAITTTHGNVDEHQTFENTQRILGIAERTDVPIYRGCNSSLLYTYPSDGFFGNDGLGDLGGVSYTAIEAQPQHAAVAMVELSKQYQGQLTILAIGSMTNIALAVQLDPLFMQRVSQLYVAAGNLKSIEGKPDVEFNAQADSEAYQLVVQNSTPDKVTIIPFSQIRLSLNISKTWRKEVLGKIPTRIMEAQNSFERVSILKNSNEWELLDPAAMGLVLEPSLVTEYKNSLNSIILCGENRGINTCNLQQATNITNHLTDGNSANTRLVYSVDDEQYQKLLINIFESEF